MHHQLAPIWPFVLFRRNTKFPDVEIWEYVVRNLSLHAHVSPGSIFVVFIFVGVIFTPNICGYTLREDSVWLRILDPTSRFLESTWITLCRFCLRGEIAWGCSHPRIVVSIVGQSSKPVRACKKACIRVCLIFLTCTNLPGYRRRFVRIDLRNIQLGFYLNLAHACAPDLYSFRFSEVARRVLSRRLRSFLFRSTDHSYLVCSGLHHSQMLWSHTTFFPRILFTTSSVRSCVTGSFTFSIIFFFRP